MKFPFPVPADLNAATDDELSTLLDNIRAHAATLSEGTATADTIAGLTDCRDLATEVTAVLTTRADAAVLSGEIIAATDFAKNRKPGGSAATEADTAVEDEDDEASDADLAKKRKPCASAATDADADTDVEDEDDATVTAAAGRTSSVRSAASRRSSGTATEIVPDRTSMAIMTAGADIPGFSAGQKLTSFDEAAAALAARIDQYPTMGAGRATQTGDRRPVTSYDPQGRMLEMAAYHRHGGIQMRRQFPDDLRVTVNSDGYNTALHASSERRLPGGSLVKSLERATAQGRSLTAAAGWCAPSEVIYTLAELETLDGLLDIPELQTTRGGWQIPVNGGPAFSAIWNGIGNSGTTHLSEANVISSATKYCYDIPCPSWEDIRLGVDYVCLTGGMLQMRGYPEIVTRFSKGALVALAHKINMGVISAIVAAAGASTVIPADPSGDDAISGLLSAIDLAIVDAKYSARIGFASTMEVVLPMWVLVQLRASGSRRHGADMGMIGLTDAQIVQWFGVRNAVPRFVYDWQDSFSGTPTGPGGAVAITALPATVQFLVYPAGTFVKAVQDVVQLDTIYDSTKLATNEYTALFAEDGWAVLQMQPIARRYTAVVDPSGVVGCCPSSLS